MLLSLVLLASCALEPTTIALDVDLSGYEEEVHPYTQIACGTLDCHGDPGRPLRIFSEYGLRISSSLRDMPITTEEIEESAFSFAGLGIPELATLKPLSIDAGGYGHEGGPVWNTREDPGYRCVRAWLDGRVGEEREACETARENVEVEEP